MDTELYPVVVGLLIRKAVTWKIPYPEYGARAMDTAPYAAVAGTME